MISGATVRRSVLFSNVKVNSYAYLEDAGVLPDVLIGRNARLKKVVIDKGCILPEGLEVGYDQAADAKAFHVTPNGVTLITPEMLGQHVHYVR